MNTAAATMRTINIEKTLFMGLASLCLVLFALYVYFISASIVHVVMRTEISQEVSKITSQISELEGKYIEAQHQVSSGIASLEGYTPSEEKIFIDRTPSSLVLSTNQSEQ